MLENKKSGVLPKEMEMASLELYIERYQNLITKYHAEVFIDFFKSRIYYMDNDYETATEYYLKAFESGRYRIGRQIKIVIVELLHCCRKIGNKKLFRRIHNWQHLLLIRRTTSLTHLMKSRLIRSGKNLIMNINM